MSGREEYGKAAAELKAAHDAHTELLFRVRRLAELAFEGVYETHKTELLAAEKRVHDAEAAANTAWAERAGEVGKRFAGVR